MKKSKKFLIMAYILIVIGFIVVIYGIPSLTGALTKTELLTYDSLMVTDEIECYVVRDEKVYSAANTGSINYYIEDGEMIRKGTKILDIKPSYEESPEQSEYDEIITRIGKSAMIKNSNYASDTNGIVGYYIDGYESYFDAADISALEYDEVKKLKIREAENLTRSSAFAGEPVFKICDNSNWYVTCWITDSSVSKYQEGADVTLILPRGEVKTKVKSILSEGDRWQIIFETNRYYEDFTKIRSMEITAITSDYKGIMVSNENMITEKGQVGVMVKSKTGSYNFTPIKILTTDGKKSIVADNLYYDAEGNKVSTVGIYDEILKKPSK